MGSEVSLIKSLEGGMSSRLGSAKKVKRFSGAFLAAIRKNPKLLEACEKNPQSLKECLLQAADLDLEPGVLGLCDLVPFNNRKKGVPEVTLIIRFGGMIELARRSGQVKSIYAELVYKTDQFKVVKGMHRSLEHVEDEDNEPKDADITHAYCVCHLMNGGIEFSVMTKKQIDKVKKDTPFWKNHYGEMAKKTVIRRLWKTLPKSIMPPEAYEVIEREDETTIIDAEFEEKPVDPLSAGKHSRKKKEQPKLEGQEKPPEQEPVPPADLPEKEPVVTVPPKEDDTADIRFKCLAWLTEHDITPAMMTENRGKKPGEKLDAEDYTYFWEMKATIEAGMLELIDEFPELVKG